MRYFTCIRVLNEDLSYDDICTLAIKESLICWCKNHETYEKAIESPNVPNTLHDKIRDLYDNLPIVQTKIYQNNNIPQKTDYVCICGNMPSNVCNCCVNCCIKNYCPRHYNC